MKLLSTVLVAAGLMALSACGGASEENTAANVAGDDLYNVAPDDLTLDNGLGNEVDNSVVGNDSDAGNAADGNAADSTGNTQ